MPIPPHQGPRTFFFIADIEPRDAIRFGIEEGIQFNKDSTLEILGPLLAFWTVTDQDEFNALRVRAQDLFDVTLALHALIRLRRGSVRRREAAGTRALMRSWVETRVESRANVIGTVVHDRPRQAVRFAGREKNDFRAAAHGAWTFIGQPNCRLALKDYGLSLRERGDDAFLFMWRAIENVRRVYAPDTVDAQGRFWPNWGAMNLALKTDKKSLTPLRKPATAVRHGHLDDAELARARLPRARPRRLAIGDRVMEAFARDQGVTW